MCGKCGATRVDQQLGLEPTPDQFVTNMVAVFREIRRVLADHGTCWVNLGDSYNNVPWGQRKTPANATLHATRTPKSQAWRDHVNEQIEAREMLDTLKPKDLVGIPWRVAFALQADGWYLRSDIIWSKPNPMPESVTDRPTKAHEYVFLLTKRPRYWFDTEAVREPPTDNPGGAAFYAKKGLPMPDYARRLAKAGQPREGGNDGLANHVPPLGVGRNVRSVWNIATQPYPEAHFATFPEELARRCILAGCPVRVCGVCGKPSERIVEREREVTHVTPITDKAQARANGEGIYPPNSRETGGVGGIVHATTVGWSDCGHNNWRPGLVLDPFIGSGTVAKVARDHGRHAIGIDLSADYLELAARRLQQLSLLTEPAPTLRPHRGLTGGAYSPPGQTPHSNARETTP